MLGSLNEDEIEEVLKAEVLGRIGFIADGKPRILPVTYVYDSALGDVYIHTAEGAKLRAMRENPNVCFEVEQVRDMSNWRTVTAQAHFEEIWNDREGRALELLATRFSEISVSETARPDRREDVHRRHGVQRNVLCRLHLTERSGRYEQS